MEGFSGGIWLLWKNNAEFHINILITHARFIHCQKGQTKNLYLLATFLYGFSHSLQKNLWKDIGRMNSVGTDPCIIGDLNELFSSRHKSAKYKGNSTRCNKLEEILNTYNLMDIGFIEL